MRYTSLTTTISHDNNNHRTSKHASTSWRSDGSPSCLGGSSHGWVPVKTHSTPVPTSVGRLWVAHQLHDTTPMNPRKRNTIITLQDARTKEDKHVTSRPRISISSGIASIPFYKFRTEKSLKNDFFSSKKIMEVDARPAELYK